MEFVCSDCGEVTTGQEVIDGAYVYIVRKNLDDLHRSIWRCANCQDDVDDYLRD
jgi:DNA-directed RNA polymerase subunit RPC12/RpoP